MLCFAEFRLPKNCLSSDKSRLSGSLPFWKHTRLDSVDEACIFCHSPGSSLHLLTLSSTGAASGFGLAITQKFLSEGAKVVAADMNAEALTKQYPSSSSQSASCHPVTANVTSQSDWAKLVETAESKFGGLDVLVNNAGTSYKNKPTLDVTEEEFDRVMNVNVKSIYFSVPAVVPSLKKRGGGSVINIASIGAMRPRPGLVWYNASKGAVANVCPQPFHLVFCWRC